MMEESPSLPPPEAMLERRPGASFVALDEPPAAKPPMPGRLVSSPTSVETSACHETLFVGATTLCNGLGEKSRVLTKSTENLKAATSRRPSSSTGKENGTIEAEGRTELHSNTVSHSIPIILVDNGGPRPHSRRLDRRWNFLNPKKSADFNRKTVSPSPSSSASAESSFNGITLDIPTGSFAEMSTLQFNRHGSLINDRCPRPQQQNDIQSAESVTSSPRDVGIGVRRSDTRSLRPTNSIRLRRQATLSMRAISADEEMLSRRVRLMYEKGEENVSDAEVAKSMALDKGVLWEETSFAGVESAAPTASPVPSETFPSEFSDSGMQSPYDVFFKREADELGGGIEFWRNIKAGDVDRYGFIKPNAGNPADCLELHPIQRVSTSLLLASETPRRKRSIKPPSAFASNRSFAGRSPTRKMSESSMRPTSSQSGYGSPLKRSGSRLRYATNHLPHNRNRRVKDEAGDMLTLPEDVADSEDNLDSPAARARRKKEWQREDKWTKMAKPTRNSKDGGGMKFEFDTQSPKVIERTWKGIPDRWRATAWYAFLEGSAKKRQDSPSEEELIEAFQEFQFISSPDDVQIDIDVPRTITSHIMFRRRYRGGQRLLFRVLHAMSLYFPETGYVQGMAAIAATLLAYYDEEHAFIMLVRLWQLRGFERLYRPGFSGLMDALNDFEREWLESGEVAAKLEQLGIPSTSYGTRWYLTLFNYSIPFPAQLRVWDVFMLLGDSESMETSQRQAGRVRTSREETPVVASRFGRSLDVLHAASAALIDGMREIILESDFENAMKVLTSWVPIKDVELFMRVAKAEWNVHRKKRGGS